MLRRSANPLTAEEIATTFKDSDNILVDVEDILKSFSRLGDARSFDNGKSYNAQTA
jgi:hypothetical protein